MLSIFRDFMERETSGGIVVLATTLVALVVANSPLAGIHHQIFTPTVGHLINDGPMVLFFLLVSLEIKRELVIGDLSRWSQAALPVVAAVGGMAVPALIYLAVNAGQPANIRGWGIPTATDIAFSLAVLSLAGRRVPPGLKIFLASLAIIDDLGAIVIISLFYTTALNGVMLALAGACVVALVVLNRRDAPLVWYAVVGVALWACLLRSGVHATLAGVAVGLAVPAARTETLEHRLHGWVAFLVVPLFVFANAGVTLSDIHVDMLTDGLFLGIALGLFFGKQIGVMAASWLVVRFTSARLPSSWRAFHGAAALTGIGFTMSLFIGDLAFAGVASGAEIRLGVLLASLLSAVAGVALLFSDAPAARPTDQNGSSTA